MIWAVLTRGVPNPNTYYICECDVIDSSKGDIIHIKTQALGEVAIDCHLLFDNFDSALRYLYRLRKPITTETDEEIMTVLQNTYETERLKRENISLRRQLSSQTSYLNEEDVKEQADLKDLRKMFEAQKEQAYREKHYLIEKLKKEKEAKADLIKKILDKENG